MMARQSRSDLIENVLRKTPARLGRSKLEPWWEDIARLREHGVGYREIAALLTKSGTQISKTAVAEFVERRSRGLKEPKYKLPPRPAEVPAGDKSDVRAKIGALKQQKTQAAAPVERERFEFDEEQPLTLLREKTVLRERRVLR